MCALPSPLGPSTALALPGSHRSSLLLGTQDGPFILPTPAQSFRHQIFFLSAFVSGTPSVLLGLTQLHREAIWTGESQTLPDCLPDLWGNPLSSHHLEDGGLPTTNPLRQAGGK